METLRSKIKEILVNNSMSWKRDKQDIAEVYVDDFISELLISGVIKEKTTTLRCKVDDFNFITKGRCYNMEEEPEGHYVILDDNGEKRLLWKMYFDIV